MSRNITYDVEDMKNKSTSFSEKFQSLESIDEGNGRSVTRRIYASGNIEFLPQKDDWKNLQSIIYIHCERIVKGKKSVEARYYISSLLASAKQIGQSIQLHWGIESVPQTHKGAQDELALCA